MTARRPRHHERGRFAREVRRTIRDLPAIGPDEATMIAVDAALRVSAPGVVPAPPIWRLFRRRRGPVSTDVLDETTLENT